MNRAHFAEIIRRGLVLLTVPAIMVAPGWSWGDVGHKVVARIAAKNLNSNARARIAEILGADNNGNDLAALMAEAAVWPDDVARQEYDQSVPWHFIDLSLLNGEKDRPDPFGKSDTAYKKLVEYADALKAGKPDELEPGSNLKFVIHLVGDIHQPLHCATNQDRGGNCLFVRYQIPDGPRSREKLHHGWDSTIIEKSLGPNPRVIADHLMRDFRRMTREEQATVRGRKATAVPDLVRAWILESHNLALSDVYDPLRPPVQHLEFKEVDSKCSNAAGLLKGKTWTLDESYVDAAGATIDKQLLAAGVRLAALLNMIWP